MKKLLLSVLCLSCCAPTLAQSSLTFYGRLDLGLRYINEVEQTALARMRLDDSSGGNLGFIGKEQIRPGLTSFFLLEANFHGDTGQKDNADVLFNDAYMGLHQEGLGRLRIGRQSSPIDDRGADGRTEAFGGDSYAGMGSRGAASLGKWNNAVMLQSEDIGGIRGEVAFAFGEQAQKNQYGAQLEYQNERWLISAAWQKDSRAEGVGTIKDDWSTASLATSYQFDTLTVMAVAARSRDLAETDMGEQTAYTVGAKMPVQRGELRLSYQHLYTKLINGINRADDFKRHRLGVGYYYPFSKQTSLSLSVVRNQYHQALSSSRAGYGTEVALRKLF